MTTKDPFTAAMERLRKKDLRVGSLSDIIEPVEGLSTGNISLDWVTTCGGLPKGRITELYGLQSSGKTTTALQAAAVAQRAGMRVLYLDYEHALDPAYCKVLGLDPYDSSTFFVSQPETVEKGMEVALTLVRSGEIGIVVVDSVASMVTEAEFDAEVVTAGMAAARKAALMASAMRKLTGPLAETGTAAVFLNHVRDVIDTGPTFRGVERKTTPGGSALKYHASVRMHFKAVGSVSEERPSVLTGQKERSRVGAKIQVVVEKNKVGPPYRKAELLMTFGHGFSSAWSVLQVLVAHGAVHKRTGGMYEFDKELGAAKVRGEAAVQAAMVADPEWFERLTQAAHGMLESDIDRTSIVPEDEDDTNLSSDDTDALLET